VVGIAGAGTGKETMAQKAFVILTLAFHREENDWVGKCLELSTSTYGRSLDRVQNELRELVGLHLNSLEDVGERERFFREHNIKIYTDHVPKTVRFDVPVNSGEYLETISQELLVGA